MARGYYDQLVKLLRAHGFAYVRAKGSHQTWRHPDGRRALVPRPCKSRHTANGILKSARIEDRL